MAPPGGRQAGPARTRPPAKREVRALGGDNLAFTYDQAGNTLTRVENGQTQQTYDWDAEGRIETVDDPGGADLRLVYDADGNRLIRDDGDTVTAYLPQTEVTWNRSTNTVDGTRYLTHAGHVVAVCSGRDVADWVFMGVDHHGSTTTHAVNAFTAVEQVRRMDPYGNPRGTAPHAWPGQQGFVGGVEDPTGLVHIGARTYDPTTGKFLSVDPVIALTDSQQINGYVYANSNPITFTDPTGLFFSCLEQCGSEEDRWLTAYANPSPKARQTGPVDEGRTPWSLNDIAIWTAKTPYDLLSPELQFKVQESTLEINSPTAYANYQAGLPAVPIEHGLLNEKLGTADGYRCLAEGDLASCFWLGVGLTPAKPLRWAERGIGSLINRFRRPAGAARHSDDANRARLPFCSFTGDTPILMADGTTAPIKDIEAGDQVLTTDPETGQLSEQTVTATWIHEDTVVALLLRIDDPTEPSGGNTRFTTIDTTPDHPFWNRTDQQWQPANTLDPGDFLHTTSNSPTTVIGLQPHSLYQTTAYNLTTTNTHTYYVLAGTTPILVHNCGPMDLNFHQIRHRIRNHVMVNHGDTAIDGTKFASNLTERDLFDGLVNRIDESNATGRVDASGNHEHVLNWPGAGANGENHVRVWMTPDGQLGSMWPTVFS